MTDGKWTRGPWAVDANTDGGPIYPDAGSFFTPFGGCGCCGSPWMNGDTTDEQVANAKLIEAAPDLADCAEELVDAVNRLLIDIPYEAEDLRGTLEALRDDAEVALAKAKGETT